MDLISAYYTKLYPSGLAIYKICLPYRAYFFALQCFLFHLIWIYFEKVLIFTVFNLEKVKIIRLMA